MGFRPGRLTILILYDRYLKSVMNIIRINLHNLFIDFSQAFDAVNRDKLFEYLE